jgi:hypothetical protein
MTVASLYSDALTALTAIGRRYNTMEQLEFKIEWNNSNPLYSATLTAAVQASTVEQEQDQDLR